MSNPNPSPETRFKPGQLTSGRTKKLGDRDRLSSKFLYELAEDFDANGKQAIVDLRTNDPGRYIAAVVAIVPKQVEVKKDAFDGLTGDKLTEAIETLTEALQSRIPEPPSQEPEQRQALNS